MKAVLVILALLGVLAFTVTVILGALAGLFLVALEDAENVNKDPENVNKVNEKSEDAKTDDLDEM